MAQQNTNTKSQKLIDNPAAVNQITKKVQFFVNVSKAVKDRGKLLNFFHNLCKTREEKLLFLAVLQVTHPELKELANFLNEMLYNRVEGYVSKRKPDGTRTSITKYYGDGMPTITKIETYKDSSSNISSENSTKQKGLFGELIKKILKAIKIKRLKPSITKVSEEEIKIAKPKEITSSKTKSSISPEARLAKYNASVAARAAAQKQMSPTFSMGRSMGR